MKDWEKWTEGQSHPRKPGKPGAFLEIIYNMEYYFQPKITEE
jgi:hypothetical protein